MKRIKLTPELLKYSERINAIESLVMALAEQRQSITQGFWSVLKKLYPNYDFTGSYWDSETKELVLTGELKNEKKKIL